ncbi:MAG: NAD(P)H-dependent oxidoreductase [Firmicutes bacterium]|nr:NAD(P)H-dependent oxidoreductase [Bacillota bacterium]
MSDIVFINGSPKAKDSVSGMLIDKIEALLQAKSSVYQAVSLLRNENNAAALTEILNARVLLIVFPLYVDSLPAPLIRVLNLLEEAAPKMAGQLPRLYGVCNCGFFEAEHNRLALEILENFAHCAGMGWGYGVGVGGGGFIAAQSKKMATGGPAFNVYSALRELCAAIQDGKTRQQNVLVRPKIPRFLYQLGAHFGWRQMAKKYGATAFLQAKPHREV